MNQVFSAILAFVIVVVGSTQSSAVDDARLKQWADQLNAVAADTRSNCVVPDCQATPPPSAFAIPDPPPPPPHPIWTVTVCPNGCHHATISAAWKAVRTGGGVISVAPGDYVGERLYANNVTKDIHLVAADPRNPPRIIGAGVSFGSDVGATLVIRDIWFDANDEIGNVIVLLPDKANLYIIGSRIDNCRGNGIFSGYQADPALRAGTYIAIVGTEVSRCGQGGTKHNIYVDAESIYADRIHSHSSSGGEAFKTVAHNVVLKNSILETGDSGTIKIGKALANISSCVQASIANNTFRMDFVQGKTGPYMLIFPDRRSIKGCDLPPYGSAEFDDPSLWAGLGDLDDRTNHNAFKAFVTGNFFENIGDDPRAIAITTAGTYPTKALQAFSALACALPVPAEWVERARVYASGNTFGAGIKQRYLAKLPVLSSDCGFTPDPAQFQAVPIIVE